MTDLIELRDQLEQQLRHLPKELRLMFREIFTGIEQQQAEIRQLTDDVSVLAPENDKLKAEIEQLRTDLELDKYAIGHYKDQIAKLQKVLEAVKNHDRFALRNAIAALETDDD